MAVLLVAQSVVVPLDSGRRVAGAPAISEVPGKQNAPGLSRGAAVFCSSLVFSQIDLLAGAVVFRAVDLLRLVVLLVIDLSAFLGR